MTLIHRFDICVHEYYVRGKANVFPELHKCPQPDCRFSGRLRKHGFYQRRAITPCFVLMIWIQRYLCPVCGHTVSLLPSFCAPRFQYTLAALFWILHRLHRLGLSTRQTLARWQAKGHAPELTRQHIQFLRRRLRHNDRLYRLFLGVSESGLLGEHLTRRVGPFRGPSNLAYAFYVAWRRPFLAKL